MIKIHRSKNNQFYFVIVSKHNGKKLATSETYTRKGHCLDGAVALASIFRDTAYKMFDCTKKNGEPKRIF